MLALQMLTELWSLKVLHLIPHPELSSSLYHGSHQLTGFLLKTGNWPNSIQYSAPDPDIPLGDGEGSLPAQQCGD